MKEQEKIRVTTKTGDKGSSSLFSGERRTKDEIVFEALGTMDELNAHLGLVKARMSEAAAGGPISREQLEELQQFVMNAAGRVASLGEAPPGCSPAELKAATERLEELQNGLAEEMASPNGFVKPGRSVLSAEIHVARAVCRRAERRVVGCIAAGRDSLGEAQVLLNRLADLLFVLALAVDEEVE